MSGYQPDFIDNEHPLETGYRAVQGYNEPGEHTLLDKKKNTMLRADLHATMGESQPLEASVAARK